MDQYIKLKQLLLRSTDIQEYEARLQQSLITKSSFFMNLLLQTALEGNSLNEASYIKLLVKYGSDPNFIEAKPKNQNFQKRRSMLMIACENKNKQVVGALCSCPKVEIKRVDDQGRNCLFYALFNRNESEIVEVFKSVLKACPQLINQANTQGKTILFEAVKKQSSQLINLLLNKSANINVQQKQFGNTILHQILNRDHIDNKNSQIVGLLLKKGGNPLIANMKGVNILQLIKNHNLLFDQDVQNILAPFREENQQYELLDSSINSEDQDGDNKIKMSQQLSIEIKEFQAECEKVYNKAWKNIKHLYQGPLTLIASKLNLQISLIGSFATGLWTEASDINIMYTPPESDPHPIRIEVTLIEIERLLRIQLSQGESHTFSRLYLKKNSKFPKLKLELTEEFGSLKLDISVFHHRGSGGRYVLFVGKILKDWPDLKPIFFTLGEIIRIWGMGCRDKGGLQNYFLFLIIWVVLRKVPMTPLQSIGQTFILLIQRLAKSFNSAEVEDSPEYFRLCEIQDPLNPKNSLDPYNNSGKKQTNIQRLQYLFKTLFYGFFFSPKKNILMYLSNLNKIIPDIQ